MTRNLKIIPKYNFSKAQSGLRPPPNIVPSLTLSGNWFAEAGFDVHSRVKVTTLEDGRILLERSDA